MAQAPVVYLDWNVISDLVFDKAPERFAMLISARRSGIAAFPFSVAHLLDIDGIKDSQDGRSRSELVEQALNRLALLSGPLCLSQDLGPKFDFFSAQHSFSYRLPHDMWHNISTTPGGFRSIFKVLEWGVFTAGRKELVDSGLDSRVLNNVTTEKELEEQIDRIMRESCAARGIENPPTFRALLEVKLESQPDTLESRALRLCSLLNSFGFFSDKGGDLLTRSGMIDSMHVSFATFCDAFCTAERRLLKRAPMAFSLCGARVQALGLTELDELLARWEADYGIEPVQLHY